MPVLQFKGKSVIESYHHTVPHHRLEFDLKLSILPKGQKPSLEGNLIIEGDNLLALKALLPTHAGKVKCIYIDPPYNTGNEGWVYNDNLTQPQFKEWIGQTVGKEGEDATRHDKWCCMMYPRLTLLKELLREDGSIWISIGDDEVQQLRSMMDEIFGESNFVASIIWRNSTGPKQSYYLSTSHEYILCYAKNKPSWKRNLLPRTEEQEADYENPDNDPRGPWRSGGLDARNYYSKGKYAITCPGGRVIDGPPGGSFWRFPENTLWEMDADNRIWWGEDKNNVPRVKRFLSEVQDGLIPQTVWDHSEVGHTQEAKQEYLRVLSDREVFTTPKPVELVQRILDIASNPGDIILDSFAGSGTTAQAVLERRGSEEEQRRFVLVQMPFDNKEQEKAKINICQTITAERSRRVIAGYTYTRRMAKGKTKHETVAGVGGSFTYARVGEPLFGEYRDLGKKLPAWEDIARYVFYTETSRECDPRKFDPKTGFIGEVSPRAPLPMGEGGSAADAAETGEGGGRMRKPSPAPPGGGLPSPKGRGSSGGTSYYLLYAPDATDDRRVSLRTLAELVKKDGSRNLVIYCEKIWLHADELKKFEDEQKRRIRPMLVPFNLK